jgi:hypothetical protein
MVLAEPDLQWQQKLHANDKLDLFNLHAICETDKQDIIYEEDGAALNHISQMQW